MPELNPAGIAKLIMVRFPRVLVYNGEGVETQYVGSTISTAGAFQMVALNVHPPLARAFPLMVGNLCTPR